MIKKLLYKFFKYEDFKKATTSAKFDYLYWYMKELALVIVLFLIMIFAASFQVRAEDMTYYSMEVNSCVSVAGSGYTPSYSLKESSSDVRLVGVRNSRSAPSGSFDVYLISESPFSIYRYTSSATCGGSSVENPVTSIDSTYNLYIFSASLSYAAASRVSYPWFNYDSSQFSSTREEAVYYTFGSGAVGPGLDYSPVRKVYPSYSVDNVSNFSYYIKRNYNVFPKNLIGERNDNKNLVLYFTRYYKEEDALISYYLLFVPNNDIWFNFSLDNSGNITIDFNNSVKTKRGLTAIYSIGSFNVFTETELLSDPSSYNNYQNWKTYSVVYSDLNKFKVAGAIFDFNTLTDSIYSKTYSDLSIPQSLTLEKLDTGVLNEKVSATDNIIFYRAVVDTEDYYDYYFLMNLYDGANSSLSSIYNYGNYLTAESNNQYLAKQYYTAMEFLNVSYIDYNETLSGDPNNGGGTIFEPENFVGTVDPDKATGLNEQVERISEEEYNNASISSVFSSIFDDITNFLNNESTTISDLSNMVLERRLYFSNAINLNNVDFLASESWVSNQMDWFYSNTSFGIAIDLALAAALVLCIIF